MEHATARNENEVLNFELICDVLTDVRFSWFTPLQNKMEIGTNKKNAEPTKNDPAAMAAFFWNWMR